MTTTRSWMNDAGTIATVADLELAEVGHQVTMIHLMHVTRIEGDVYTKKGDGLWVNERGNAYFGFGLGSIPCASPWHAANMRLVHGKVV